MRAAAQIDLGVASTVARFAIAAASFYWTSTIRWGEQWQKVALRTRGSGIHDHDTPLGSSAEVLP
jgi:hypothetical protein